MSKPMITVFDETQRRHAPKDSHRFASRNLSPNAPNVSTCCSRRPHLGIHRCTAGDFRRYAPAHDRRYIAFLETVERWRRISAGETPPMSSPRRPTLLPAGYPDTVSAAITW
jgi:hypothetical protein